MKVLQLIDSLNPGGAERVAVNYSNALTGIVEESFLCTTRVEGLLKQSLLSKVNYLFLDKKSTLDFKAIKKLNYFVNSHSITVIHAHASSFLLATIIKLINPKITLIWHEHYGNRERTSSINKFALKICSYFFSSIIVVNESLKNRSVNSLYTKNVYVLLNYPIINSDLKITTLHGEFGKRIICLANLRPDKDHLNLLKAFNEVYKAQPEWSLHLIGQYYNDEYYDSVKEFIKNNSLENHVYIYGSCPDTKHVLNQGAIGILTSKSEGLPLALLEYGLAKLPVIATNVGDCIKVISSPNEGFLIEPKNHKTLANTMVEFIDDTSLRKKVAENLHLKVVSSFSESQAMDALVKIYKQFKK